MNDADIYLDLSGCFVRIDSIKLVRPMEHPDFPETRTVLYAEGITAPAYLTETYEEVIDMLKEASR